LNIKTALENAQEIYEKFEQGERLKTTSSIVENHTAFGNNNTSKISKKKKIVFIKFILYRNYCFQT
jgi:hypothetical protein